MHLALPMFLAAARGVTILGVPGLTSGDRDPGRVLALYSQQIPSAQFTTYTLNVCFCLSPAPAEADMVKAFTLGDVGCFREFSDVEDRRR